MQKSAPEAEHFCLRERFFNVVFWRLRHGFQLGQRHLAGNLFPCPNCGKGVKLSLIHI